jgi:hypothetical protein
MVATIGLRLVEARTAGQALILLKAPGFVKRNDVIVRIDFRSGDDRRCVKRSDKAIDWRGHRSLRGACHRAGHFGPDPLARNGDAGPV